MPLFQVCPGNTRGCLLGDSEARGGDFAQIDLPHPDVIYFLLQR